ncbi:MAG: MgtC/SapB family protein [Steroidobacteraceae bacterium]
MHPIEWLSTEGPGQTGVQLAELALALLLSSLIGLEREFRVRSAGLRTHTLVGVAAALIMLVSKYGFTNVLQAYVVVLDPSRVAAQIVSGIGFIGGGLIFVQRDVVRGLTTAATIWLTAAVGMACGAGLPVLALFVTGAHFLIMYGYTGLTHRILSAQAELLIHYRAGKGAVHEITRLCTGSGFAVHQFMVKQDDASEDPERQAIRLRLRGRGDMESLVVAIGDLKGVISAQLTAMQPPRE